MSTARRPGEGVSPGRRACGWAVTSVAHDRYRDAVTSPTLALDPAWITRTVAVALDEDLGPAPGRDVTTQSTIPADAVGAADLVARQDGVVAGLVVAPEVVGQVAARLGLAVPPSTSASPTAPGSRAATCWPC